MLVGKPFKGIERGATVNFVTRNGIKSARVNALLIFPGHVVVNHGTFGTLVDEVNYAGHKPARAARGARR